MTRLTRLAFLLLLITAVPALAHAQAPLPVPTQPVAFCVSQAAPPATVYQLTFDAGTPEAVTMTVPTSPASPLTAYCNANHVGWTHAFTLPAARFPLGTHRVIVLASNQFGTTPGPNFPIIVGLGPGQATILGAGQLP